MLTPAELHDLTRLLAQSQDIVGQLRAGPSSERLYEQLLAELRDLQHQVLALLPPISPASA